MKTGIFVGSFDPFTIGHDSIVRRALPLFDKIVIGIGANSPKKHLFSDEERLASIHEIYADEPKVSVKIFDDLTVSFAKREQADFIIKGIRSVKDFEYEREQADFNRKLTGIETVLLFSEPQLASVSSSMVRELILFGVDVSEFIPKKPEL